MRQRHLPGRLLVHPPHRSHSFARVPRNAVLKIRLGQVPAVKSMFLRDLAEVC